MSSISIFGIDYEFQSTGNPIILSEEEARLEEMRNDTIRDEYDGEVYDCYCKYDLSDSRIWKYKETHNESIINGNRTASGNNFPVNQCHTWKKYVAKTTGKTVYQLCEVYETCDLDNRI